MAKRLIYSTFKLTDKQFGIYVYALITFAFFNHVTNNYSKKTKQNKNNFLLTEREGRTGEYWPEVVTVQTSLRSVRTKTTEGQYSPERLELAQLVSSLLYGLLITFCFVFASP